MQNSNFQFPIQKGVKAMGEDKTVPRFLSIRQTSKAYGISERYLRMLDHENRLPGFKSGNRTNVNVPMLLAQLERECERR